MVIVMKRVGRLEKSSFLWAGIIVIALYRVGE